MLEHGTVYLLIPYENAIDNFGDNWVHEQYVYDACSDVNVYGNSYYITTNLRVLVENNLMDDLKYICEPTKYHERRVTVRFVCSTGLVHNLFKYSVHRNFSTTEISSNNKEELIFITPSWADDINLLEANSKHFLSSDEFGKLFPEYYYHLTGKEGTYFKPWNITKEQNFIVNLKISEQLYLELLNQGLNIKEASLILPNALKTELVITGFISDWKKLFNIKNELELEELLDPLKKEFIENNYINE